MGAPQLKIDAGKVNLTPAEWIEIAAFACGERVARVEIQVRTGTKGAPLVLESEQTSDVATLDGPDGPAELASRYWRDAVEYATRTEGRIAVRLVVTVPGDDQSPFETGWVEPGDAEITVSDPGTDSGASLAWRMVAQMHNAQMRNLQGIAGVLQSLNIAAMSAMNLSGEAIEIRDKAGRGMLEAQKELQEIGAEDAEMERYERMFDRWLTHMAQSKAMNTPGETITPPGTVAGAAGTLHSTLTLGQVQRLIEILGDEVAHDVLAALSKAGNSDEPVAVSIVQTILIRLAQHQEALEPVFAPPFVPLNIAALQSACLRVLGSASPLH